MAWYSFPGRGARAIDEDTADTSHTFSLAEARALLPEIQLLIARFNRARISATEAVERLEDIEQRRTRGNLMEVARPLRQAREDLGEQAERMREVIRAVRTMGVEIKRLDPVLLDFPARRGDRVVYLCWEEGEATIGYWHEIEDGFAGRQPLT